MLLASNEKLVRQVRQAHLKYQFHYSGLQKQEFSV